MSKVTHKGKQYTIGGLYEFSDNGERWYPDYFMGINDGTYIFKAAFDSFERIREIQNPIIGTIEDAPMELADGGIYQFKFEDASFVGVYDGQRFVVRYDYSKHSYYHPTRCENIFKLVPEVKDENIQE